MKSGYKCSEAKGRKNGTGTCLAFLCGATPYSSSLTRPGGPDTPVLPNSQCSCEILTKRDYNDNDKTLQRGQENIPDCEHRYGLYAKTFWYVHLSTPLVRGNPRFSKQCGPLSVSVESGESSQANLLVPYRSSPFSAY